MSEEHQPLIPAGVVGVNLVSQLAPKVCAVGFACGDDVLVGYTAAIQQRSTPPGFLDGEVDKLDQITGAIEGPLGHVDVLMLIATHGLVVEKVSPRIIVDTVWVITNSAQF